MSSVPPIYFSGDDYSMYSMWYMRQRDNTGMRKNLLGAIPELPISYAPKNMNCGVFFVTRLFRIDAILLLRYDNAE